MAQGLETMKAMNQSCAGKVAAMDPTKPSNTLQARMLTVVTPPVVPRSTTGRGWRSTCSCPVPPAPRTR